MQKIGFIVSTTLLALAAACSPADTVPAVYAQSQPAQVVWPAPAPGSVDGQVYEY
jgi:hypothetical protein